MALTVTEVEREFIGGQNYLVVADVTFDDSYPTGGEVVAPADFRFGQAITALTIENDGDAFYGFDRSNSKLTVYDTDGTEATNASDQSGVTIRVVALGR